MFGKGLRIICVYIIVDPVLQTVYAYCQIKYYIITYMESQSVRSIL